MGGGGLKEIFKRFEINVETPVDKVKKRGGHKVAERPPEGTFGRRLFDSRTGAGLSQGGVAKLSGVNQAMISAWERGASDPFQGGGKVHPNTKKALLQLADVFGWSDLLVTIKSVEEQLITTTRTQAAIPDGMVVEKRAPVNTLVIGPPKRTEISEKEIIQNVKPLDEALPKPTSDEKALARSLTSSDVYFWAIERENECRKLRIELAKYEGEDMVTLREKARKFDEMQKLLGNA